MYKCVLRWRVATFHVQIDTLVASSWSKCAAWGCNVPVSIYVDETLSHWWDAINSRREHVHVFCRLCLWMTWHKDDCCFVFCCYLMIQIDRFYSCRRQFCLVHGINGEKFSMSTYRLHRRRMTSHRADCGTAQPNMAVIPMVLTVEHWTLPARSSLVVCRCGSPRSAHCRHRHRHKCKDRLTYLHHQVHMNRMPAAAHRLTSIHWHFHLLQSNTWADGCWCSMLKRSLLRWTHGRWIAANAILVVAFRSRFVEILVFGCFRCLPHRLRPDERRH